MLPLISNFCYIVYFDLLWYTFFSFLYGELCDGRARSSARHAGQPRVSEVCGLPASACVNQLTQLRLSPPISSVLSLGEFLWTRRTFGILFRLHFPWHCTAWIRGRGRIRSLPTTWHVAISGTTGSWVMCCLFLETAVEMWFYCKVLLPY